jgi:hypothetical protein
VLDLDFAFLHMLDFSRRGLAQRGYFLNRLAPLLYSPRLDNLIDLCVPGGQGGNLLLPLGMENWKILNQETRKALIAKIKVWAREYSLPVLAVDRQIKNFLSELKDNLFITYGDKFINLLTVVFLQALISEKAINKIVFVGETTGLASLLEYVSRWQIPIGIQNYQPIKYERLAHNLLYEKGIAISNSQLNPRDWDKGEIIVGFSGAYNQLSLLAPQSFYIALDNNRNRLAPDIENRLMAAGLNGNLSTLAPILENFLFYNNQVANNGIVLDNNKEALTIEEYDFLIERGWQSGLWNAFLDKGITGLYNTIKEN